MNAFIQNIAVLILVGVCVAYVVYQTFQALVGRKSKIGSCCAKGCSIVAAEQAAGVKDGIAKVQFLPLEALSRKRPIAKRL